MNSVAALFHYLDFASGMNGTKGVFLDFVGQGEHCGHAMIDANPAGNPASLTRILLLDLLIYFVQVVTVAVCYVVNFTPTLPKSDLFPYDDLLLPPDAPPPLADDDVDVEAGDQFRQRRMGKGPRYQNVATEENEVWLEEDDEEAEPASESSMKS